MITRHTQWADRDAHWDWVCDRMRFKMKAQTRQILWKYRVRTWWRTS